MSTDDYNFTNLTLVIDCISISNLQDNTKGRQMPIHYSAKKLNIQCVSSTLATQVPNAVGYAYSNKVKGINAVSHDCSMGQKMQ